MNPSGVSELIQTVSRQDIDLLKLQIEDNTDLDEINQEIDTIQTTITSFTQWQAVIDNQLLYLDDDLKFLFDTLRGFDPDYSVNYRFQEQTNFLNLRTAYLDGPSPVYVKDVIADIQQDVQTNQNSINAIDTRITNTEQTVTSQGTRLTAAESQIQFILAQEGPLYESYNYLLNLINSAIAQIGTDTTVGTIKYRIKQLENTNTTTQARLTALESANTTTNTTLSNHTTSINTINTTLTTYGNYIDSVAQTANNNTLQIQTLKTDTQTLGNSFRTGSISIGDLNGLSIPLSVTGCIVSASKTGTTLITFTYANVGYAPIAFIQLFDTESPVSTSPSSIRVAATTTQCTFAVNEENSGVQNLKALIMLVRPDQISMANLIT